ncbi:Tc toxin subunit A [Pseudomonas sp. TMB3-21]
MDRNDSLLQQLVDSTFSDHATKTEIKTALHNAQIDSVFDIASLSAESFADTLALLNAADALHIYDEAVACAHMISRLYYEQQLSPEQAKQRNRRDADQVSAPLTYQSLFDEDWQQFCHEGHIAANNSPIAYLRALYRFALELENSSTHANRITLEERRCDLAGLILDAENTFVERPMVSVINETLNTHIQNYLDEIKNDKTVQEVLASERYPLELPYDLHHQQCQLALGEDKPALGELNYRINLNLPFSGIDSTYGGSSKTRIESQKLLSALSPAQQKLLTAPYDDHVVWNAYGSRNNELLWSVDSFQKLTGLTDDQIEELLADGKYLPNRSINNLWSERHHYGRLYINRGSVGAVMAIDRRFVNFSTARLDCMIRMTRLRRWTGISFAELDTMIMNIELASPDKYSGMNNNTLRALGVYRYLSKRYSIKPEEFASFYYNMPTYACGDRRSLFDQKFSNPKSTTNPLIENNGKDIDIETSVATLKFLKAGLDSSVTQDDFLLIARQCKQHLPAFKHDLSSASAIYRYARIAQMFGLSPAACTDLARLLGGEPFCKALVTGVIREDSNNESDIFDVLMAMDWAVDWLRQNKYSVKQWCRLFDKTRDDEALNTELENLVNALKTKPHDTDDKKNLLIQTLLLDVASLSLDEIACSMKLAGTSEVAIFDEIAANTSVSGKRLPLLASALRAGEAVQALVLTNDALLKLLNNTEWLAHGNSGTLTPHTLYLLDRFSTCTRHHVQAETRFLEYLERAHGPSDAVAIMNTNITLTELLDWTIEEVSALTADLPHHCARSIEEVDWVIRCKNCCNETGLSMNNLKRAVSLNTEKPAADWKIVGEALVAAHS